MRGTSFSKRRNRWRAAGIEIDFGRLPLLKGRGPGRVPRTDKSCRSDQDGDKSLWRPPEATTLARLDTSKRGSIRPWPQEFLARLPTTIQKKKERGRAKERRKRIIDSLLLLPPTRRLDVASRRPASGPVCSPILLISSNLRRAPLRMDLSAFPLCHSRVTVLYDRRSRLFFCGPPSSWYHLGTSGFSSRSAIADFPSRSRQTLSTRLATHERLKATWLKNRAFKNRRRIFVKKIIG